MEPLVAIIDRLLAELRPLQALALAEGGHHCGVCFVFAKKEQTLTNMRKLGGCK